MQIPVVRTHLIGFIWLATAIDVWCCQFLTPEMELNPLAGYILAHWGVWTLVSLKIVGTWVATEWMRYLPLYIPIIVAITMAALLLFLAGVITI
jgi:hypothetical protein